MKEKSPQSKSDQDEQAYKEFLERGKQLLNKSTKGKVKAENVWMKEEVEDEEKDYRETSKDGATRSTDR